MFDFEFRTEVLARTSTGSDNNVIDGDEYLKHQEFALHERLLQHIFPLRKYMFWKPELRKCREACAHMTAVGKKILDTYRSRMFEEKIFWDTVPASAKANGNDGEEKIAESIMGRIVKYDYDCDAARISDMVLFLIAGHETTAHTLAFFLMEMAKRPVVTAKLQRELDAHMPKLNVDKTPYRPTYDDVIKLDYLTCCIKETMRLWPVAGGGSTRTTLQDIHYEDQIIPCGSTVNVNFYAMFRQPWIDNAEDFIPERWNEQTGTQVNELNEMFMPFSAGHRNCIGQYLAKMQLHVLAANFMRHYTFEMVSEPDIEKSLTLRPKNLKMKIHRR
jgi:hypothetical protein